jgi:hypothetical protein
MLKVTQQVPAVDNLEEFSLEMLQHLSTEHQIVRAILDSHWL